MAITISLGDLPDWVLHPVGFTYLGSDCYTTSYSLCASCGAQAQDGQRLEHLPACQIATPIPPEAATSPAPSPPPTSCNYGFPSPVKIGGETVVLFTGKELAELKVDPERVPAVAKVQLELDRFAAARRQFQRVTREWPSCRLTGASIDLIAIPEPQGDRTILALKCPHCSRSA